ncbi:6-bladed beta-propeller [Marinilabiliaceae bacterium N1Y90]|nr:6-bladed beta-propeller [Marinilabiliaceae bacterium N1Y90]
MTTTLTSCQNDHVELINITLTKEINQLSDSTYLGDIAEIKKLGNDIFALDRKNRRLIVLDHNLQIKNSIGSSGKGPGEFISPNRFTFYDNNLWIFDGANLRFSCFDFKGHFQISHKADDPLTELCSFFGKNDKLYYMAPKDLYKYSTCNITNGAIKSFYQNNDSDVDLVNMAHCDKYETWFRVNQELPVIEVFNKGDEIIKKIDLPVTWFNRLNFTPKAVKESPQNTKRLLIQNICCDRNHLYLMYIDHSQDYTKTHCNKIIQLKISDTGIPLISEYKLIKLLDNWYTSFCVSGNEITAFNSTNGVLEQYKIIENEKN